MQTALLTLEKVGMLLLFIAAGYLLRRTGKLPKEAGRVLSVLTTTIFCPAYTIRNLSANLTTDKIGDKAMVLLWGLGFILVSVALAWLPARFIGRTDLERRSLTYAFSIPNYGYFGYPVIEGVFGAAMLADVMVFVIPVSIATNTFGILSWLAGM